MHSDTLGIMQEHFCIVILNLSYYQALQKRGRKDRVFKVEFSPLNCTKLVVKCLFQPDEYQFQSQKCFSGVFGISHCGALSN